jgi:hypothetical protein
MFLAELSNLAGSATALSGLGKSMWALGCAECYTTSSALSGGAAHALDKAILVLGIPPLLMFLSILLYLYRRGRAWRTKPARHILDSHAPAF